MHWPVKLVEDSTTDPEVTGSYPAAVQSKEKRYYKSFIKLIFWIVKNCVVDHALERWTRPWRNICGKVGWMSWNQSCGWISFQQSFSDQKFFIFGSSFTFWPTFWAEKEASWFDIEKEGWTNGRKDWIMDGHIDKGTTGKLNKEIHREGDK